jgi:hypothetical protein
VKLFSQLALLGDALFIKRLPSLRDWHHQWNRPAPQGTDHKFHCVYRLQTLHATSSANETDHFIGQVRRLSVAQQL